VKQVPASSEKNPEKTETVTTEYGDVRGVVLNSGVELFAGIPYAAPPVGDRRWKEPEDPESWSGVRECDTFAPMSMQVQNNPIFSSLAQIVGYHDYKISLDDNYIEAASEDSLYINLWRPKEKTEKAPVVVYIHGGSLQTGQPWYADYRAKDMQKTGSSVSIWATVSAYSVFLLQKSWQKNHQTAQRETTVFSIRSKHWNGCVTISPLSAGILTM
jgi:para-nitrobenzyl esterase